MILGFIKRIFRSLFRKEKNWIDMAFEMEEVDREEREMKRDEDEEQLKDEMHWTMVEGIDLTEDDYDY